MCTATALACAGSATNRVKATDSGWDMPATASAAPPRRDERWDVDGQLRLLEPVTKRARSEHRGGDFEGEVLTAKGVPYPPRGASTIPPATTLVERLFAAGGSQAVALLVMVKQSPGFDPEGGDWEYLVVSPQGRVEDRGKLAPCARCHAEAPRDHLFGGPR
jgi:hypothetical protein